MRARTVEPLAAVPAGDDERARVRRGLRYCLAVFLALRVGLTVLGLAGVALLPHPGEAVSTTAGIPGPVGVPGWPAPPMTPGWHNAVTSLERFDGLWFLRIATDGYEDGDGSAAFFPGYPLLIRAVSPVLGGHPLAAALLISNAAALVAMVALYFLTAGEFDERVARRAVLYLAVFPTSFFLLAPYSEALFLLLVLVSLWGARRGKWWLAGVAGAAAAATRNVGVVLVLPLVVEALHQRREGGLGGLVGKLAWSVLPVIGLAAYLGYWQALAGDWLAPVHQQANWQRSLVFAPTALVEGTRVAFRFPGQYPGGYHLMDWLVVAPALMAAGWAALRTRPLYGVYTWSSILAPLSFIFVPRPFMSLPRFLLVVFPLLWAPAVIAGRRPWVHGAVVAVSSVLQGILALLFVNWYFVF
jgi:Mannosyltransferase (PIG-V)